MYEGGSIWSDYDASAVGDKAIDNFGGFMNVIPLSTDETVEVLTVPEGTEEISRLVTASNDTVTETGEVS